MDFIKVLADAANEHFKKAMDILKQKDYDAADFASEMGIATGLYEAMSLLIKGDK